MDIYKLASLTLFLSALVQLATTVAGNFASSVLVYVPFGIMFLLLAIGLFKHKRWAAWLSFLLLLIGVSLAIAGFNTYTVPNVFYYIMLLLNIAALMALFVTLWRHSHPVEL